jgi:ABC-type phosphonate transport system ATPase subunit
MIIRLGQGEKRLNVKEVRAHWVKLHKAQQIKILHVEEPESLAAYFADQRRKKRLGGEMAWQDGIVRWRWSKGWLPKGFTRAYGRVWHRFMEKIDDHPGLVRMVINDWLQRCHIDQGEVERPPKFLTPGETV